MPDLAAHPPVPQSFGTIAEYVNILEREITATGQAQPKQSLTTIFLGGGTPSLLTAAQLHRILDRLDRQFGIAATAEISMEIDPDTFDLDRLRGYVQAGVNRVSLGVQAFQTEILQACGRTHTAVDVYRSIDLINQVGLKNFSLDLISGLPHLTLEHWQESLAEAIALAPTHLSVYDLTIEPNTSFDRWYQPGAAPLPTEEMTAQMYRVARQQLTTAGYEHYEISNYARPGFQCQHNRVYWENRSYYGFGMAAASYTHHQRFTRPRKRSEYFAWVTDYRASHGAIDCEITSPTDRLLETLMLGLRLAEGLNLDPLREQFGDDPIQRVLHVLQPYQQQGWVTIDRMRIHLSDPEGFLFSNVILSELFKQFQEDECCAN